MKSSFSLSLPSCFCFDFEVPEPKCLSPVLSVPMFFYANINVLLHKYKHYVLHKYKHIKHKHIILFNFKGCHSSDQGAQALLDMFVQW